MSQTKLICTKTPQPKSTPCQNKTKEYRKTKNKSMTKRFKTFFSLSYTSNKIGPQITKKVLRGTLISFNRRVNTTGDIA